jgi:hypothetical protein
MATYYLKTRKIVSKLVGDCVRIEGVKGSGVPVKRMIAGTSENKHLNPGILESLIHFSTN